MDFSMGSLALLFFIFLLQLNEVQAETRYDVDDGEGIIVIVILIFACIVLLLASVFFIYIVYKLWNAEFGRRHYVRSISREKIVMTDQHDGSRYSTYVAEPLYSSVSKSVKEEVVAEEKHSEVVETRVEESEDKTEEVIVTQAPPTAQAEMETQELVIVFDDNDDVIDVITNIT